MKTIVATCLAAGLLGPAALAQHGRALMGPELPDRSRPIYEDGKIKVDGRTFRNWNSFRRHLQRTGAEVTCGSSHHGPLRAAQGPEFGFGGGQFDCAGDFTNPAEMYATENGPILEIDVVFHVIRTPDGLGHIDIADIRHSLQRLNEEFSALPGTPGEGSIDSGIRFRLADLDPEGRPAFGIQYHDHRDWFADPGSGADQTDYSDAVAWDPHRYLNIYTNDCGGSLGYATIPQYENSPEVGSRGDRIVMRWDCMGENPPIGDPYALNRVLVHEVGHWCGLWHVFTNINPGVCDGDCQQTGDTLCDTTRQVGATWGCDDRMDCGTPNPIRNYMSYSDDDCKSHFTPDQVRRMRCTLMHWRPLVFEEKHELGCNDACPADLDLDGTVGGPDLGMFMAEWGPTPAVGSCADLNDDGVVDGIDLGIFMADWGACLTCPEGWSEDCFGQCFPNWLIDEWKGDGICDDGSWVPFEHGCPECPEDTPIYLNCTEYGLDDGDCVAP